jgi:alkyl sulfatase BDS1-like metallo-beta-lactamase superfamily hydrolase
MFLFITLVWPSAWAGLRRTLDALALGQTTFPEAVKAGLAKVEGDAVKPDELLAMLDTFNVMFEVVEPKKAARR